jgi:hypothetical protein
MGAQNNSIQEVRSQESEGIMEQTIGRLFFYNNHTEFIQVHTHRIKNSRVFFYSGFWLLAPGFLGVDYGKNMIFAQRAACSRNDTGIHP